MKPDQIATIALIAPIKIDWSNVFALSGASYFVGYLFYVLSSCLDSIYDNIKLKALKIKEYGDNGVKPKKGSVWNILFPYLWHTHTLVMIIAKFSQERIGAGYFNKELKIIDSYQFAFRWLIKEKLEMYAEAERYLATALFFRSMVFVWGFGAITWGVKAEGSDKWYGTLLVVLGIISFFAYLNRWRKAHHVAFKNVIILEGRKNDFLPQ